MKVATDRKITFKAIEDITHKVMNGSRRALEGERDAAIVMVGGPQLESQADHLRCLIDLVEQKTNQVTNLLEQLEYIHKAYSQQIINCNALVRQNHELTKRFTSQFTKV